MPEYYVGLMSGTSMDGIDAALVDFSNSQIKLIASHLKSWPDQISEEIIASYQLSDDDLKTLDQLDASTGEMFAHATNELLEKADIDASDVHAIGSHGQTIRHRPDIPNPYSLQIGNARTISTLTGINVVSDFRTADIQAGGEGAPLAPAFHEAIFRHSGENRTVLNIGGIANFTVLPADTTQAVIGFDSGPGNTIMDAWTLKHQNKTYDKDGSWAASGKINTALLKRLLQDEYFSRDAPKSTGFEYFNCEWLESHLEEDLSTEDIQATLCELTAQSIAEAIKRYNADSRILVCGGGYHNQYLIKRLQTHLPENTIESTEDYGVHPDWVEAMAFAWLARQTMNGVPGNLPSVTGAITATVLGTITNA
jgi:anhydro-N-acetylmuramic acid kinase